MPKSISVRVADLLANPENPRLETPNAGQREVLREIAKDQDRKLLKLAEDIVEYGVNPTELFCVVPTKDEPPRYIVLEGNRRLCALKALEAPDTISGVVSPATFRAFKKLSSEYLDDPIDTVECISFRTSKDARHWLALKHIGQNEGAGTVQWNADQTARFRGKELGVPDPHHEALNLAQKAGFLSATVRAKLHTSTFKRLIDSPDVREKLGIDYNNRRIEFIGDRNKALKAIAWVAKDIVDNEISVANVYHKADRQKYARKIPANIVVKPVSGTLSATKGSTKKASTSKARSRRRPKREVLIPHDCVLSVKDVRAQQIELELRGLNLDQFTNAVAVLFRVLIEMSVDWYLADQSITVGAMTKLGEKVGRVGEHLRKRGKLTESQVKPVRQAAAKGSYLGPTITLFNAYVHETAMFPAAGDLRQHWNSLQPFIQAIWSP